ncbi:hypothetical protein M3231_15000 [Neobacillus mesonae]|nr:hypothetical protein [Neobacillus mesonae]
MFEFLIYLPIGIFTLIAGVRALKQPDSWPFNRHKDELDDTDIIGIQFRGIILLASGIVFTILSFQFLI